MKLAKKVHKKLFENLFIYNGKKAGSNLEAGDTSLDHDHWHKTQVDVEGNGVTIKTLPDDHGDHVHEIKDYRVMAGGEDDHTHNVLS